MRAALLVACLFSRPGGVLADCDRAARLYRAEGCCGGGAVGACRQLQLSYRENACCNYEAGAFAAEGVRAWLAVRTTYYAAPWQPRLALPGAAGAAFATGAERDAYVEQFSLQPVGSDNATFRALGVSWASCSTFDYYFRGACADIVSWGFDAATVQTIAAQCPVTCFVPPAELMGLRVPLDDFSVFLHPRDAPQGRRRLSELASECADCDPAQFYDDISGIQFRVRTTACDQPYAIVLRVLSDGYVARNTTISRGTIIARVEGQTFDDEDAFLALFNTQKNQCIQQTGGACKGAAARLTLGRLDASGCAVIATEDVTVYRGPVYDDALTFSSVIDETVGYFKFARYAWTPLLRAELRAMLARNLPHVVLDVRGNAGGMVSANLKLCAALGLAIDNLRVATQPTQLDVEPPLLTPLPPLGFPLDASPPSQLTFLVDGDTDSAALHTIMLAASHAPNVRIVGHERTGASYKVGAIVQEPVPMRLATGVFYLAEAPRTALDYANPLAWDDSSSPAGIAPNVLCEATDEILPYDSPNDGCFAAAIDTASRRLGAAARAPLAEKARIAEKARVAEKARRATPLSRGACDDAHGACASPRERDVA